MKTQIGTVSGEQLVENSSSLGKSWYGFEYDFKKAYVTLFI